MRTFRFDFSYSSSKRGRFLSDTEFDSLIYRFLDIPTLYLDNIIGYGVELECI